MIDNSISFTYHMRKKKKKKTVVKSSSPNSHLLIKEIIHFSELLSFSESHATFN